MSGPTSETSVRDRQYAPVLLSKFKCQTHFERHFERHFCCFFPPCIYTPYIHLTPHIPSTMAHPFFCKCCQRNVTLSGNTYHQQMCSQQKSTIHLLFWGLGWMLTIVMTVVGLDS